MKLRNIIMLTLSTAINYLKKSKHSNYSIILKMLVATLKHVLTAFLLPPPKAFSVYMCGL
jgi:hypothetical protein